MRILMQRSDFEFDLPPELIAQQPAAQRSASRLLCLDGLAGVLRDLRFVDLPALLEPGDLLIFNDTRVIPARVFGTKPSGGRVEMLLERATGARRARVQLRASKPSRAGTQILLPGGESAQVVGRVDDLYEADFSCDVRDFFERHGRMPLPPYIARDPEPADQDRYQTVFAREPGAVAAPTAGLHFDAPLLAALAARGVESAFVTLHVGAGTFSPVREQDLDAHRMHEEHFSVPGVTAMAIGRARLRGSKVVAVGTTVVRTLECAAIECDGQVVAMEGETRLFIRPGFRFRVVDGLITNFHLPGSTLLMLCAALAGRGPLLAAYRHAIDARYRFFSYGDAMFITPSSEAGRPVPRDRPAA